VPAHLLLTAALAAFVGALTLRAGAEGSGA
jgi:hypothetical protein